MTGDYFLHQLEIYCSLLPWLLGLLTKTCRYSDVFALMGEFVVLTHGFKKKFEIYLRVCICEHTCMWGTAEIPLELDSQTLKGHGRVFHGCY